MNRQRLQQLRQAPITNLLQVAELLGECFTALDSLLPRACYVCSGDVHEIRPGDSGVVVGCDSRTCPVNPRVLGADLAAALAAWDLHASSVWDEANKDVAVAAPVRVAARTLTWADR